MLWNDDDGVTTLFARAFALHPKDAEVAFRYGSWLVDMALDKDRGLELIGQTLLLKPEGAVYPYEMAKILRSEGKLSQALPLLQMAINLLPQQLALDRIRASNFSKTDLRRLFVVASKLQDINHSDFLGLDLSVNSQVKGVNYWNSYWYYGKATERSILSPQNFTWPSSNMN